jgi:TetR/AcrR family transcriptional repressor of nem operon
MNKGEITRQMIIEKAAPIFNRRGYEGCSMQDIMDATGLEKGGLYRHFASKEELAAEAFRYALASVLKVRTGNMEHIQGSLNQLRYLIQRFVEVRSPIPGGCPLMNTAIDADDGNPVLLQLARKGIMDWTARIRIIVEEGMRKGEIRKTTEPRKIANTIVAMLEGALMLSRVEGNKLPLQDAQETLESVLSAIAAA